MVSSARAQEFGWTATHYGESYNGNTTSCGTIYRSSDETIIAIDPTHYTSWPCGSHFRVEGPVGSLEVIRVDVCPGCSKTMIDLSEAGVQAVCGGIFTCRVNLIPLD